VGVTERSGQPSGEGAIVAHTAHVDDPSIRRDRALAASAGAALVARVVIAGASLVSIAVAARSLTHSELGVVAVLTALLVYFGLGDFGLGTMLMTRLPAALARDDHEEMRRLVSGVISVLVLVAGTVSALATASLFVFPWPKILGAESIDPTELRWALVAFIGAGAAGMIGTTGTRVLAAMQRGAFARMSSCVASVVSVLAIVLCTLTGAPLWAYVVAFSIPTAVLGPVQMAYVMITIPFLSLDRSVLHFRRGIRLIRTSSLYAVLSSGWVITYALDAVVVAAVLGAAQAAVFSVAARLFGVVSSTLYLAGQQMWPALSEALTRRDLAWVRKRFRQSFLLATGAALVCSLVLIVFGQTIARVWVGHDLVPPLSLFIVSGLWTIYMTAITQYSYLLLAAERIKLLSAIGVIIAAVNLPASIVCTHLFGITGPILGNLVAAGLVQCVPTVLLTRQVLREI